MTFNNILPVHEYVICFYLQLWIFKSMSNSFHCTGLSLHWLTLLLGILFGAVINGIVLNFSGNFLLYRNARFLYDFVSYN